MELSYWEIKSWFTNVDFTIVGSGIVGLSTGIHLRKKYPHSKIIVLERSSLPQGASTKNAGFACVGSLSEILDDLNHHTENEVYELVCLRAQGLQLLRETLGEKNIGYQHLGGHEIFLESKEEMYNTCLDSISKINNLLKPFFTKSIFSIKDAIYPFENLQKKLIFNNAEGQIDTGKMMRTLLKKAIVNDIIILNNQELENFSENLGKVSVKTSDFEFSTQNLIFTNNGFASNLVNNLVKPARAQVLITKPIPDLNIQGTFQIDSGYYYFRNIDNRILIGGGRNLDFEGETTTTFGTTSKIQNSLEELLKNVILPNIPFEIEHRWSGIMGVGNEKKPIVEQLSNHVYCGVRMGGMGIAIGSIIGKNLAKLIK